MARHHQQQGRRGFLQGKDERVERTHQHSLPDEWQGHILEGCRLPGAHAFRRFLERFMNNLQGSEGPADRVRHPPHPQDNGNDNPNTDQGRAGERQRFAEGSEVGDADPGPGKGENQGSEGIEEVAPGQLGSSHHPGDGDPDQDADQDRDPGIQQAVKDKLGSFNGHPFEILQGVFDGKGSERPPFAEGIEENAQIGDKSKNEDGAEKDDHADPRAAGKRLSFDHRIGERAVVLQCHVLLRDNEKKDSQQDHDGGNDDPHFEQPTIHELHDVEVGL